MRYLFHFKKWIEKTIQETTNQSSLIQNNNIKIDDDICRA
jgi:hypothetical protein